MRDVCTLLCSHRPPLRTMCAALLLPLCLLGCTTSQTNRMYFAAADVNDANPNVKFYRLTMKARSMNSKAQLSTGFYDANAVRALAGEVQTNRSQIMDEKILSSLTPKPAASTDGNSDTDKGAATEGDGDAAKNEDGETSDASNSPPPPASSGIPGPTNYILQGGQWIEVPADTLFTIVYGTNADEIANQINSFYTQGAAGQMFGDLVAAAWLGDSYMKSLNTETVIAASNTNVLDTGKKLQAAARALTEPEQVKNTLNSAVQTVLGALLKEQENK